MLPTCTKVFNEIDADGNGYITPDELQKGFKSFGVDITAAEAKEIVKAADTDKDGRISYTGRSLCSLSIINFALHVLKWMHPPMHWRPISISKVKCKQLHGVLLVVRVCRAGGSIFAQLGKCGGMHPQKRLQKWRLLEQFWGDLEPI